MPGLAALKELHVWGLSTSRTAVTSHLQIDPTQLVQQQLSHNDLRANDNKRWGTLSSRKKMLQLEAGSQRFPDRLVCRASDDPDPDRSHHPDCACPCSAKPPGSLMAAVTVLVMASSIEIPYTPIGSALGMVHAPLMYFAWLTAIQLCHCLLTQLVKSRYVRRFGYS